MNVPISIGAVAIKNKNRDISELEQIKINDGVAYAIDTDKLLYLENGKHDIDREDPYKYFRFLNILFEYISPCQLAL